jgi:hypothetical protein
MGPLRWIVFAILLSTLCVAAVPALAASPPPGATALCRDGTYSYSQHHSGTCSHHGGVAKWLDSTTTTTSSTAPASTPTSTPALGRTVLLARRTRTSGCSRGSNPDPRCSPGATYSGLTKAVICSSTFRTSTIRNVPDSEKHAVEIEYGMEPKPYGRTMEIDHIVSLELGGSNDIANLFPEPGSGQASYHAKDRLENKLHSLVCSGGMTLHAAQVGIASHWQALYLRVFGVPSSG